MWMWVCVCVLVRVRARVRVYVCVFACVSRYLSLHVFVYFCAPVYITWNKVGPSWFWIKALNLCLVLVYILHLRPFTCAYIVGCLCLCRAYYHRRCEATWLMLIEASKCNISPSMLSSVCHLGPAAASATAATHMATTRSTAIFATTSAAARGGGGERGSVHINQTTETKIHKTPPKRQRRTAAATATTTAAVTATADITTAAGFLADVNHSRRTYIRPLAVIVAPGVQNTVQNTALNSHSSFCVLKRGIPCAGVWKLVCVDLGFYLYMLEHVYMFVCMCACMQVDVCVFAHLLCIYGSVW